MDTKKTERPIDAVVPALSVESDGCGYFEASLEVVNALRGAYNKDGCARCEKDVMEIPARMWLAKMLPVGGQDGKEQAAAEREAVETVEQYRQTAIETVDSWIESLQALKQQLVSAEVVHRTVRDAAEVIYPST